MVRSVAVQKRQTIACLTLAGALALAALWIGAPFIPALLWAGVVTIAVDPLRGWLLARMGERHTTVAALLTACIALLVVIPVTLIVTEALFEARSLTLWATEVQANGMPIPDWVHRLPFGSANVARWWNDHLATPEAAAAQIHSMDTTVIIDRSKEFGHGLFKRVVVFGFTMVCLFFTLRDRDRLAPQLARATERAFGETGLRIGRQIVASVRGTIDGLVLVGLAQGTIVAIVYLFAGVPHPILLGLLSGIASIIPFGLIAVSLIAILLLIAKGAVTTAIVVGATCAVTSFIADHFVKPVLIGGTTKLPFLWVFIGIVGGVETLGLLGLFVGPAVMAALILIWRDYVGGRAPEDSPA